MMMNVKFNKLFQKLCDLDGYKSTRFKTRDFIAYKVYMLYENIVDLYDNGVDEFHDSEDGKILGPFNIYDYKKNIYHNDYFILSFDKIDIFENNIIFYVIKYSVSLEMSGTIYKYVASYEDEEWNILQIPQSSFVNLNCKVVDLVDKVAELYKSKTNIIFPPADTDINYAIEFNTFIDFCKMRMQQKRNILIMVLCRNRTNGKHWLPNELFNFIFDEFLF